MTGGYRPDPEALLRTQRLQLRPWRDEDLEPLADLHADAEVMALFPAPLSRTASDAWAARATGIIDTYGTGPWALSPIGSTELLGAVGVFPLEPALPGAPGFEVGWRLRRDRWGLGLASEAAAASLDHAFTVLGVERIVAFTAVGNARSRAVMGRLGMMHRPDLDFAYPGLGADHPLSAHVLYEVTETAWWSTRQPANDVRTSEESASWT
jgi:RimJ/RimL family protein N-acetyltransferase